MAFCISLILFCVLCSVVLVLIACKTDYNFEGIAVMAVIISFFVILFCSIELISQKIEVNREINNFVRQSEYIESIQDNNSVENAALNNTKIELNEWLYNAQYNYENFWFFTFYPSEIMELEEIR